MDTNRQTTTYYKEFSKQLAAIDAKIEVLDKQMVISKLTTNEFLKKLREYQLLVSNRELVKRKIANTRAGINPWGDPVSSYGKAASSGNAATINTISNI